MANMRFFLDYVKHYLQSTSRHGTHSPFVYKLVDEVVYDFGPKSFYESIEAERATLKKDEQQISVTDLGAGSMLNKNKTKAVKTIARNALKPPRVAQLLARLAHHFQPRRIIELGTCLGITSAYLSKAAPGAHLDTVEGCPQTASIARRTLNRLGVDRAELHTGNFDDRLPQLLSGEDPVDLFFVDGNHREDATWNYFIQALPKATESSLFIFDDIYWSEGMKRVWERIKEHPDVTVTVDLFYIGLVFFKKDQAKEHFRIRF